MQIVDEQLDIELTQEELEELLDDLPHTREKNEFIRKIERLYISNCFGVLSLKAVFRL